MNGKIELETMKLAAVYKQSLKMEGTQMLHPLLDDLQKFLHKNISENDLDRFIDAIKRNSEYFPNKKKLSEIYNIFRPSEEKKYIGFDENEMVKNYSIENKIPREPDPCIDTSRESLLRDEKVLDNTAMLKKYGVKICGDFWKWIVENMTDSEKSDSDFRFHSTKKYQYKCDALNLCNYEGSKNPLYFQD